MEPVKKKKKNVKWNAVSGNFDGRRSSLKATLPDGYEVTVALETNSDGVLGCTEFSLVWSEKKPKAIKTINSRYFQELGFGDLLSSARSAYIDWHEIVDDIYLEDDVDKLLNEWKSRGSNQIPDKYYAAIAWKYEKFVLLGLLSPIAELAGFMGVDRPTASSRVSEARKRGLLTSPKKGGFGGQLTNAGKRALGIEEVRNA